MSNVSFEKLTFKYLMAILALIGLCAATRGYFIGAIALYGVVISFVDVRKAILNEILLAFIVMINTAIVPKDSIIIGISLRFGILLIAGILAIKGMSKTAPSIPAFGMIPVLAIACLSSSMGWYPLISYMKLVLFSTFFLGVWHGSKFIKIDHELSFHVRAWLFAICMIVVIGSLMTLPFPGIAYATSLKAAIKEGGVAYANRIYTGDGGAYSSLFSGIIYHSQDLAPLLACLFTWLLCDMLFVERRPRPVHIVLLALSVPMLYMTRSRVGFLSLGCGSFMVVLYMARQVKLPDRLRHQVAHMATLFVVAMILAAGASELYDNGISRWIRKTNDIGGDNRSLSTAITESRQGCVEESMYEFHQSPFIGKGFQVDMNTRTRVGSNPGIVLSAPIEKGVLPLMVLGELGIVGEICFCFFVFSFIYGCHRKRLYCTNVLFVTFLATNMGEATFFSAGGSGGMEWLVCILGGFAIDMLVEKSEFERRQILVNGGCFCGGAA